MRIAVISDIHGNRTAFEALLEDLRETAPDLIFHGGDLADNGSSPAEIVDRIRDLGWHGVLGNTDEMLCRPESLREFAAQSPAVQSLTGRIEEMAAWARETLGQDRLAWLAGLPLVHRYDSMALVHASPVDLWRAPLPSATDTELETVYGNLRQPIVVYGHIHRSFIRNVAGFTVANAGSASLSYDGDSRASYLLIDESVPQVRRVEYQVDKEIGGLRGCGLPYADWVARILTSGTFQMP